MEPQNARYHLGLGNAYGQSAQKAGVLSKFGLAKKCRAEFERAVELEPANVDFHQALFGYYQADPSLVGGGADKAATEAAIIKKLDPARGRQAFAALYVGEKKYELAFAEYDEVLKASPTDYSALYQVGRLAAISGQNVDRGLASLQTCLEATPPTGLPGHAAVHWRIGNLHEKKGDPAKARIAYEAALKIDPNHAAAAESLKKLK